jgi:hypothetical protein
VTAGEAPYKSLIITPGFLDDLIGGDFSSTDQRRIVRALRLLDTDERHPSLRVHLLQDKLAGTWSASASDELRITFERLEGGRKLILTCSHHYRP